MTLHLIQLVGRRLREARESVRMTLSQAAEQASLSTQELTRFEAGHDDPSLNDVRRLAILYGVTLDHLAGAEDPGWQFHYTSDGEVELLPKTDSGGGKEKQATPH